MGVDNTGWGVACSSFSLTLRGLLPGTPAGGSPPRRARFASDGPEIRPGVGASEAGQRQGS
eukprot:268102-Pyramimonas_sp.AAC.1